MSTTWKKLFKNDLKHLLLNAANISRIHIVGCSRSGTTMLHYSMVAFTNTLLYDKETTVWGYPGLKETLKLFRDYRWKNKRYYLITKRPRKWYCPANITRLAGYLQRYNIFLINITSTHPLDKNTYYITPEFWHHSIEASRRLGTLLREYPNKLTIRYEDLILNPAVIATLFSEYIGLQKMEGVSSIQYLKENTEMAGNTAGNMIPSMHNLRNFDPASIGKWKNDPLKAEFHGNPRLRR
jgi:hypothetical protein